MFKNEITERLQIEFPIIQAPMAGGVTTSALVAAVSNQGALGMIGAGYMNPAQTCEQIREIKRMTPNNFGINLFVPQQFKALSNEIASANHLLQPIRDQLHLPTENRVEFQEYESALETFNEQVSVVIEERVPVCSFTFGIPPEETIQKLREMNVILIGTATTVREAIEVEKMGMDMVVVQGSEAGGHRGNFINDHQGSLIGLMSLIPQVADSVGIPVISAGGIMDGRGLMASLCLGAKGVQMGTAFLTCLESGAHNVHKKAILQAGEDDTVLTRAFSGKWARGIKNTLILDMQEYEASFPDFPIQNVLTQDIRKEAAKQNNREYMSLWSGQSPRMAQDQTAETLVKKTMDEAEKIKTGFYQ